VSGLQTQGYKACSTCGPDLEDMAKYSRHLRKIVYLGHTKFFPIGHEMRSHPLLFSSTDMPYGDERPVPEPTTFAYWKSVADRVADPDDPMVFDGSGLSRWSILTTLPYWGELKIRHLLDPMHIEGNVGKALIKALYGEKDANFRQACEDLEVHPDVWVIVDPIIGIEYHPSAPWVLSIGQRREFCNRIGQMQFPTGTGSLHLLLSLVCWVFVDYLMLTSPHAK
jgi:Transposase family tnp2